MGTVTGMPPIVLASNRGPVSFTLGDDGDLQTRRGAGGLINVVGGALDGTDATWIAAAMSEGDRVAAGRGVLDVEG